MSVRRLTGRLAIAQGSDRKGPAPAGAPSPRVWGCKRHFDEGLPGADQRARAMMHVRVTDQKLALTPRRR